MYGLKLIPNMVVVDGAEVSLADILVFFCGASNIPPLGFDTDPCLAFDHDSCYPFASTCAMHLTLPAQCSEFEKFRFNMNKALTWHGGFGCV